MSFWKKIIWLARDPAPEAHRIRRVTQIVIVVALFVVLFWIIPVQQVIHAILHAKPAQLVIGFLLGLLATMFSAAELVPLSRKQGLKHSLLEIIEINLAVKFYTQFTPSALVGTGLRWYRLAQPGNKVAEAFAAMTFYRLLETFVTVTLGVGFWFASDHQNGYVSVIWLFVLIVTIILSWIGLTRFSLPIYKRIKRHSGGLLERPLIQPLERKLEKLLAAISAYADIPAWDLLLALSAGVIYVLTGVASGVTLAKSVGIDIGYLQMGWIQAVILIATQLPFAVAGGVGIREVTLVTILATFGISPELALAYSFLLFVRGLFIALLGGLAEAIRVLSKRQAPAAGSPVIETPRPTTKET